jgi:hypothetical protein
MSEYTILIHAKPYIVQYFRKVYGIPCKFQKKSFFNLLLGKFLIPQPVSAVVKAKQITERSHSAQWLRIALPHFENKDIRTYNHLSNAGTEAISRELRNEFYLALMNYVRKFLCCEFARRKEPFVNTAIRQFIEEYELDFDCYSTLVKQYQRTGAVKRKKFSQFK